MSDVERGAADTKCNEQHTINMSSYTAASPVASNTAYSPIEVSRRVHSNVHSSLTRGPRRPPKFNLATAMLLV